MPPYYKLKLKNCDRRMVCRDCGRTLDVFVKDGNSYEDRKGGTARRPTGAVPAHELLGVIPDAVLNGMATVVYRCHRRCGRVVLLDLYDVWRRCAETVGDRFEV